MILVYKEFPSLLLSTFVTFNISFNRSSFPSSNLFVLSHSVFLQSIRFGKMSSSYMYYNDYRFYSNSMSFSILFRGNPCLATNIHVHIKYVHQLAIATFLEHVFIYVTFMMMTFSGPSPEDIFSHCIFPHHIRIHCRKCNIMDRWSFPFNAWSRIKNSLCSWWPLSDPYGHWSLFVVEDKRMVKGWSSCRR